MVKHTQIVGNLPTNSLSVFDHFVGLALKELKTETTLGVLSTDGKIPVTKERLNKSASYIKNSFLRRNNILKVYYLGQKP